MHQTRRGVEFSPPVLQGMRVVNLVGFGRGHGFLGELLALAKPFGDVVKHLVLDVRPEVKPCPSLTVEHTPVIYHNPFPKMCDGLIQHYTVGTVCPMRVKGAVVLRLVHLLVMSLVDFGFTPGGQLGVIFGG